VRALGGGILFFLLAAPALAHGGEHHLEAGTVLSWWTWDPWVLILLALSGALYAAGLRRLWRRAGTGQGIRRWEAACFAAGWLALVVALVSPLDALGEILFSAHMAQHEVLILVAAPLMVLGRPLATFVWALPPAGRVWAGRVAESPVVAVVWGFLTAPLAVWLIHGVALWVWHLPSLYQATLDDDLIHAGQHLSFFVSAALFWWSLVHGRFGRLGYGAAVLYVFTTSLHSGVLGALLTFAPHLWYPIYDARTAAWGLSALEDQQLAGLIMWVPAGLVFILLGLALFAAWLGEAERRVAHTRSETLLRALEGGGTGRGA
jgi:putative membrane protein